MAEWLVEEGIGESRAALIEDGAILEAAIELDGALRAGTVAAGRLAHVLIPLRRGIVALDEGGEALIEPIPAGIAEGARLNVEIVREAIPEAGRNKLPKCRRSEDAARTGPTLLERTGGALYRPPGRDRLEQAGWSELLEEAATGEIAFEGGALRMSLTPAMTLFDVDGPLPPEELAVHGAAAAGRAIRRLGIGGSIGIDLPTLPGRAARQVAAAALDAALPQPFERTAVNGFGFLQLVRRRTRPSLAEIVQGDPAAAAARALLRRAEWSGGAGERTIHAAPPVASRIKGCPHWLGGLSRRIGAPVRLQAEPDLPIWAGHVQSRFA